MLRNHQKKGPHVFPSAAHTGVQVDLRVPGGKEEAEMIPTVQECLDLMDRYHMLENIKAHSVVVARVSCLIATGLREAGLEVSVEMTTAAALLHDIGKTASLKSGLDHSEIGRQICMENQLPEIAPIVAEHVRLRSYSPNGDYSEKEIVYYSDKRVNHDRVVSLEERLAYILERYGRNKKDISRAIEKNFSLCLKVQEKLFRKLRFSPEALPRMAEKNGIMCV